MIDTMMLVKYSTAMRFPKGAAIINEGDTMPYSMYHILHGTVQVVKNFGKEDQTIITSLKKGDFFGEMSLFLLEPRAASVIAEEDVAVLEINQTNVYEIIMQNPEMTYVLLKTLCSRLGTLNKRIHELTAS